MIFGRCNVIIIFTHYTCMCLYMFHKQFFVTQRKLTGRQFCMAAKEMQKVIKYFLHHTQASVTATSNFKTLCKFCGSLIIHKI